jgi:hypothetical protein
MRQIAGSELLAGLVLSLDAGGSEVLRFHVVNVPEPSTVVTMTTGMVALLAYALQKRRRSAV